ncbi:hypothetical protein DFJ73DRAFT_60564 [Zopfochytrium polystomum]|nr:hypothetical protein DFJ73DRAFT_60564 [Zopfochytrium polystomum]
MFRSTQLQPFFRRRVLAECHAPTRPLDLFDHLVASRAIASQLAPHPMLLMLAPPRASHIVPAEVLSPNVPVGIDWFRAHLALDFLCVFCLRVPLAAEPLSSPSHPPSSLESLSSVSSDTLVVTSGAGTPSRRNRSTSSSAFDFLAAAAMASSIGSAGFVTFADNPPNDRRNAERTKSGEIHTPSLSTPHRTAAGMSCELPALLKKMRKGNGWWSLDTGLLNCDECLRRSYCSHCDSAKRECVGGASKASCLRNTACPACYNASFRNCTTCAEPLSSCPRCSLSYNDDAIPIVPPPARAPTGGIANFELTTSVTPAFGDLPVVPQFLADASATADMDEVWSSAWRAAVKGVHGGGAGGTYSAATLSRKKYFCSTRCRDVYVNGGL